MKKTKLLMALATLAALASSNNLLANPVTSEENLNIDYVFAPKGFDSNDSTEIVVSGMLPNLCYKSPKAIAVVEGNSIKVRVTAIHIRGAYCAQMFVPFIEVAQAGVLAPGNYGVEVTSQTAGLPLATEISVVQANSSSVDDFVYAHVDWIETFKNNRKVVLHGYNPSDCFEIDTIEMVSNGKDAYSILPIMKQVRDVCPIKKVPFAYEADVPTGLTARKILLHTRITNGKSVNALFSNVIED